MKAIKLVIIDDDQSYRSSLRDFFRNEPVIQIDKEYDNGTDFINDIETLLSVDVCLIDYKLADISGLECAKKMKEHKPNSTVIIMTAFPDLESFTQTKQLGGVYVEKSTKVESLLKKVIFAAMS